MRLRLPWRGRDPCATSARTLAYRLGSFNAAQREQAAQQLAGMGPEAVDVWAAVLARLPLTRRAMVGRALRFAAAMAPAYCLCVWAAYWVLGHFLHGPGAPVAGVVGGLTGSAITTLMGWHLARSQVAALLAGLDDPRAAGVLTQALAIADRQAHAEIASTLGRLLPRVGASLGSALTPRQRDCLYRALLAEQPDLVVAVLEALERGGEGAALPFVQKLLDGHGAAGHDARVAGAAARCLPVLQARAEQERASPTLLRPAEAPADAALLRPAESLACSDPKTLLRSVEAVEEAAPQHSGS